MHENRETSETPTAKPGRRSAGEGKSHTARAYVFEESHSGIVPMNHSNKDGEPSAESAEGRPLIKENACQPNTYSTQSGKGVSQGLAGVRKAAKENKEMKVTALLHHLTVDLLRESFYSLKRKAAPGVDGVTWQEYEPGLEDRLVDLHSRVHRGAYRATPSRRVYIEKADGRQRPLGVAALEDKLVQQAVATILNQIYEEDFLGFSYGFRSGRSQHDALDALSYALLKNPRKNALLKDGNKSDRIDAHKLAELLYLNKLNPVYHGEHGTRALKELVRSYLTITNQRTGSAPAGRVLLPATRCTEIVASRSA